MAEDALNRSDVDIRAVHHGSTKMPKRVKTKIFNTRFLTIVIVLQTQEMAEEHDSKYTEPDVMDDL